MADLVATITHTEFERHERALTAELPANPPLEEPARKRVAPFVQWCASQRVRHAPAKPTTVAAFVLSQASLGVDQEIILAQIEAVERLHDHFGLANPVATFQVRHAVDQVTTIEAPRSWRTEEKILFKELPVSIRAVISRREKDRDTALRRAQNEIAEERKRLKAEAEIKSAEPERNDNG